MHRKGPGGCLRGAMKSNQLKMDGTFDPDLQHFLFKPDNWHHGVDLFAINIARGREHGIGSYGAVKAFCKNHRIYQISFRIIFLFAKLSHGLNIRREPPPSPSNSNFQQVQKTQGQEGCRI